MVIDFHAHVLPRVDHGSRTLDDTRKQFKYMRNYGVDRVVATSHFYPHVHQPNEFIRDVDDAIEVLRSSSVIPEGLEMCIGAEILVCDKIYKMYGFEKLCIRGTDCVLLEMPAQIKWSKSIIETVETIIDNGFTVVLAHIDRYIDKYSEEIDRFIEEGALFQLNSDSLASIVRRKKVLPYLQKDAAVAIGSDLHGPNKSVCKDFAKVRRIVGEETYDRIMQRTEKLLENAVVIK